MRYDTKPYDQIQVGETAELERVCSDDDLLAFAAACGDHGALHSALPESGKLVAPPAFVGGLVSAVVCNLLPGLGAVQKSCTLDLATPAAAGDALLARATVAEKRPNREVLLEVAVTRPSDGALILSGQVLAVAPDRPVPVDGIETPGVVVLRHRHFDALVQKSRPLDPIPTAVAAPEDANSLGGAMLAARETIIHPILVGDPAKVRAAAQELGVTLDGVEIVEAASHAHAASLAVDLVADGRARALMKGHLHTDDLLRAALRRERGLRAGRRFTHVFVMDVPGQPHPILITDAAINIAPDLETKVDITQNAIDLAKSLGFATPKVAVLSAVETVNPALPSSVDAALLSKMADRGQITGGLVEGPLAMDNAVSLDAARTKGIVSPVAGQAEILVVPNLDAGNMLAKQLAYVANGKAAGVVLGARVPIILNSRSDDDKARLASCAIAALHAARTGGVAT